MITNFKVIQKVMIYSSSFFLFYFWDNDRITPFLSLSSLYKLPFTLPCKFMVSFSTIVVCLYVCVWCICIYPHIPKYNLLVLNNVTHMHNLRVEHWVLDNQLLYLSLEKTNISKCYSMMKWSQMLCVKPDQGEQGDWDKSEHQDSNLPLVKVLWVSSLI